jgi:hypothetical protein
MIEKRQSPGGNENRNDYLDRELVYIVQAPQIIDDTEKEYEKAARDQHRQERLVIRIGR